jgi:ankyrin repeat protein
MPLLGIGAFLGSWYMGQQEYPDFHMAASQGNLAYVTQRLEREPSLLKVKAYRGQLPLHFAAEGCRKEMVDLLLAKGAEMNAKDEDGTTPLNLAAFRGCKELVAHMIARGATLRYLVGLGFGGYEPGRPSLEGGQRPREHDGV